MSELDRRRRAGMRLPRGPLGARGHRQTRADGEFILPLMRELLEFNHGLPGSAHIGIRDEHVWVSGNRRLEEVRSEDVAAAFAEVMGLADSIDDALVSKYAGTIKKRRGAS